MIKYLQSIQHGGSLALENLPDLLLSNVGLKAIGDLLGRFRKHGVSEDQINLICQGFINYAQFNKKIDTETLTLEEYVSARRPGCGMGSFTAVIDWAQGFTLSPQLRAHPIVQQMNTCLDDFLGISNDVQSLPKEILHETPTENNMVCQLMRRNNSSAQEAMYEATEVYLVALNDLDMVISCIGVCELSTEEKEMLYVYAEAVKKAAAGTNIWSYATSRYEIGLARITVSPDTTAIDKYKLRPACQWLREKYILNKAVQELPPDSNPVPIPRLLFTIQIYTFH